MCIAMNGDQLEPGQYAVSTSNRNFEGRQGKGGRTFLASSVNRRGYGSGWCRLRPSHIAELIMVTDEVWKLPAIVDRFLSYRAALPLAQEQIGVMMAIIKTRNQPVEKFLDLGCGDGILGAAILGEYPNSRGVFVDFSEPMLAQAREQLKDYASQLSFENLDYGDPDWVTRMQKETPFDVIVSGYSIHHQPDARKRSIYAEIFSLLKPGGWFINIEHIAASARITI